MHQVTCYYCNTTLYLFQARQIEIKHRTPDGQVVPDEIDVCYWCALKEEEVDGHKE